MNPLDRINEAKAAKIKLYPCNHLRASEIGHPCERYLVLSITHWQDRVIHDVGTQYIFDFGNSVERYALDALREAGMEFQTPLRSWQHDKPLITGREDVMLRDDDGAFYPVEIKGLNSTDWERINSTEDMLKAKSSWLRKYPAQLQIYLLQHAKERGWFMLVNKLTGRIKFIPAALDYSYAESLLQRAERVYSHIVSGTLPNTLDDLALCEKCPLLRVCGASIDRGGCHIDDGEVAGMLDRMEELRAARDEYNDLDEQVKTASKQHGKILAGDWIVEQKERMRSAYAVPESKFMVTQIRRIK